MALGGFKAAFEDVTYSATSYPTFYDWGLAIHKAKCRAFLRATAKGGAVWTVMNIVSEQRISWTESFQEGGQTFNITVYATDTVHGSQYAADNPGFVTFFRSPYESEGGAYPEFAILTARCFNTTSDPAAPEKVYFRLGALRLPKAPMSTSYVMPNNNGLAFAYKGFSNYDLSYPAGDGELQVISQTVGYYFPSSSTTQVPRPYTDTRSILYGKLDCRFGFAVKENAIISFGRPSSYASGTGYHWDLIGDIFTQDAECKRWGYVSKPVNGSISNTYDTTNAASDVQNVGNPQALLVSGFQKSGARWPKFETFYSSNSAWSCSLWPATLPFNTSAALGGDLFWSAVSVSFAGNRFDTENYNYEGIDGQYSGFMGFLRNDMIRCISGYACKTFGTRFNGGNFITTWAGYGADNSYWGSSDYDRYFSRLKIGFALGWDPSNSAVS